MRKAKEGLCLRWRMPFPNGNLEPEESVFRYEGNKTVTIGVPVLLDAVGAHPEHVGDSFTQGPLPAQLRKQVITVSAVDHVDRSDRRCPNTAAYERHDSPSLRLDLGNKRTKGELLYPPLRSVPMQKDRLQFLPGQTGTLTIFRTA